jgi:transposase
MTGFETMTKRRRRLFSPEFKSEVVALCRQPGRSVPGVCQELGLAESAVRRWVTQAEVDAGVRPGMTSAEVDEVARLRKQLREVTEERDILARAVGSSPRGPDDRRVSGVRRGGEAGGSQRRQGVRAARGVPFRLLRVDRPAAADPGSG